MHRRKSLPLASAAVILVGAVVVCLVQSVPVAAAFGFGQPPPNYEGKEFYTLLDVAKDATEDEIRRRYRVLARQHHPDLQPAGTSDADAEATRTRFQAINEAYDVLSDKVKRRDYDAHLRHESAFRGGPGGGGSGGRGGGAGGMPGFENFFDGGGAEEKGFGPGGSMNRQQFADFMSWFAAHKDDFDIPLDEEGGPQVPGGDRGGQAGTGRDGFMTEEERDRFERDGGRGDSRNMFREAQEDLRKQHAKTRGGGPSAGGFSPYMFFSTPGMGGPKPGTAVPPDDDDDAEQQRKAKKSSNPFAQYAARGAGGPGAKGHDRPPTKEEMEQYAALKKVFDEYEAASGRATSERRAQERRQRRSEAQRTALNVDRLFGTGDAASTSPTSGSSSGAGATTGTAADPLEAAYSADAHRTAFDPHEAEAARQESIRRAKQAEGRAYVTSQYPSAAQTYAAVDPQAASNVNSPDDDSRAASTGSFADYVKQFATYMAKQYADSGTMPPNFDGDFSKDPKTSAAEAFQRGPGTPPAAAGPAGRNGKSNAKKTAPPGAKTAPGSTATSKNKKNKKSTPGPSTAPGSAGGGPAPPKSGAPARKKGMDFSQMPDMSRKPTYDEMREMSAIFREPEKHAKVPDTEPAPHDPWYQTIFKDTPPDGGMPSGDSSSSGGGRRDSRSRAPVPGTKKPKKTADTTSTKNTPAQKKANEEKKKEKRQEQPPAKPEPAYQDADYVFSKDAFEEHCEGMSRPCVLLFTSATSRAGMHRTFTELAQRFPLSAKTFYITRSDALAATAVLFEAIQRAHGADRVPPTFREALCGPSYERATLTNAGEYCAVVVRGSGQYVQVVGRQRLAHIDLLPALRVELAKNKELFAQARATRTKGKLAKAPTAIKDTDPVATGIITGKIDAESLVFVPLKRNQLQYIQF